MKAVCNAWRHRQLDIKSRITIVNTLVLSMVGFLISVLPTPSRAKKEIKDMTCEFIWKEKRSKIAYQKLIQKIANGGLKLCSIEDRVKASNIAWVRRMLFNPEGNVTRVVMHIYKWVEDPGSFFITRRKAKRFKDKNIFAFYAAMFKDWQCIRNYLIPGNVVYDEIIWYNKFVNLTGFEPEMRRHWILKGICRVRDVFENGELMSARAISRKFDVKCTFIEYYRIKKAIPEYWKNYVKDNPTPSEPNDNIMVANDSRGLEDIVLSKTNDFYWFFVKCRDMDMAGIMYWIDYNPAFYWSVPGSTPAENLCTMAFKTVREVKFQSVQYMILSRTLPCNNLLRQYRIQTNDKCNWCDNVDDVVHFLVTCTKCASLWSKIFQWLKYNELISSTNISNLNIVLGLFVGFNRVQRKLINTVCMFTKFFVYRQKLYHEGVCLYEQWYTEFKNRILREKFILKLKPKADSVVVDALLEHM